ncbi:MAG: regulatory iron-sulfur-containing complex subunit RicT [Salinivirgaceae bacterium]|jgi:cell fate regulator YaaT (PSP1 superfamily)|nr:regulatory iron-sulfur-containing complex subunit RicT [Salinivirgaceae bacterium]
MTYEFSRGCPIHHIDPEQTSNLKIDYSGKLNVFDWLNDIPKGIKKEELYEIRFKNTRKGYFYNLNGLRLDTGDIVAVESSPGHDIGIISLKGPLVLHQLHKLKMSPTDEFKTIYRKAKPNDIEKWKSSIDMETPTMIESRKISADLKLNMKIGDVEYQGDKTKAIFYYIADERVDFRQLIKVLAERFRIRVEMRQIGARQEAGRIGGIGSCGRELCCSTWVSNFVSVTTNSARYQELSLNPQKLAGQCSKLKCCLNYEIDSYMDARKNFPSTEIHLNTEMGKGRHFKTDVHRAIMWYIISNENGSNIIPISVEKVKEIIIQNKKGVAPEVTPLKTTETVVADTHDYNDAVGEESLTRFDHQKDKKKRKKKRRKPPRNNETK